MDKRGMRIWLQRRVLVMWRLKTALRPGADEICLCFDGDVQ